MRAFVTSVVLAAAMAVVHAQPNRPLPLFEVVDASGNRAASTALGADERIVLAYVKPDCRPCAQLLAGLARIESVPLPSRLVVVVGGPVDQAAAFVSRSIPPTLQGAAWFADEDGQAASALDLHAAPVILGVGKGTIEWRFSGVPERRLLDSLVRTWLSAPGGVR